MNLPTEEIDRPNSCQYTTGTSVNTCPSPYTCDVHANICYNPLQFIQWMKQKGIPENVFLNYFERQYRRSPQITDLTPREMLKFLQFQISQTYAPEYYEMKDLGIGSPSHFTQTRSLSDLEKEMQARIIPPGVFTKIRRGTEWLTLEPDVQKALWQELFETRAKEAKQRSMNRYIGTKRPDPSVVTERPLKRPHHED